MTADDERHILNPDRIEAPWNEEPVSVKTPIKKIRLIGDLYTNLGLGLEIKKTNEHAETNVVDHDEAVARLMAADKTNGVTVEATPTQGDTPSFLVTTRGLSPLHLTETSQSYDRALAQQRIAVAGVRHHDEALKGLTEKAKQASQATPRRTPKLKG